MVMRMIVLSSPREARSMWKRMQPSSGRSSDRPWSSVTAWRVAGGEMCIGFAVTGDPGALRLADL